jgi:hypothetical protein
MQITDRQRKAIDLVASGALNNLVHVDVKHVLIPSACVEGAFYVSSRTDCTCPDARYRARFCKHQIALQLLETLERSEGDAPHISNTTIPASMRAERED